MLFVYTGLCICYSINRKLACVWGRAYFVNSVDGAAETAYLNSTFVSSLQEFNYWQKSRDLLRKMFHFMTLLISPKVVYVGIAVG